MRPRSAGRRRSLCHHLTFDLCPRYDARGRPAGRGHHLTDDVLSPRARALYQLSPPALVLNSLRQLDRGVYVCRADFIQNPSRVGVTNLTLIGKYRGI